MRWTSPCAVYASNQQYYREAFVRAFASVEGYQTFSVYVTDFQPSSAGTTLIYFDTILFGTDYDTVAANAAVLSLFNGTFAGSPRWPGWIPVGGPALPALVNAFIANGLPVAGAYYNDQLTTSTYIGSGSVSVNASEVGTWQRADIGEAVALDIGYANYANNQQYYKEAFAAAMAATLGLGPESVWVNDFQQSAAGNVLLYFDVSLSATSSTAISTTFADVQALFIDCHPATGDRVGCPAQATPCTGGLPCNSTLVSNLIRFGLPVTNAFYNQQNAPTSG